MRGWALGLYMKGAGLRVKDDFFFTPNRYGWGKRTLPRLPAAAKHGVAIPISLKLSLTPVQNGSEGCLRFA